MNSKYVPGSGTEDTKRGSVIPENIIAKSLDLMRLNGCGPGVPFSK